MHHYRSPCHDWSLVLFLPHKKLHLYRGIDLLYPHINIYMYFTHYSVLIHCLCMLWSCYQMKWFLNVPSLCLLFERSRSELQFVVCSLLMPCSRCVCKPGYDGDGYSCTEANLCLKSDRGGCHINVSHSTIFNFSTLLKSFWSSNINVSVWST